MLVELHAYSTKGEIKREVELATRPMTGDFINYDEFTFLVESITISTNKVIVRLARLDIDDYEKLEKDDWQNWMVEKIL